MHKLQQPEKAFRQQFALDRREKKADRENALNEGDARNATVCNLRQELRQ